MIGVSVTVPDPATTKQKEHVSRMYYKIEHALRGPHPDIEAMSKSEATRWLADHMDAYQEKLKDDRAQYRANRRSYRRSGTVADYDDDDDMSTGYDVYSGGF